MKNYCVIMAGGVGSRFWPMSTTKKPKQFIDILGLGRTMIQQTFDRISQLIPAENIFVITNSNYVDLCTEQLPELPAENIVGEPEMKNTAACNIYMANRIKAIEPDANIVVLPADHLILKEAAFLEKVKTALEIVDENNYLVTLGITPTRPDTGYGYIKFNADSSERALYPVVQFMEKPDLATARYFLRTGGYLWNAGIFIWKASAIVEAFKTYLPEMEAQFENCDYNTEREALQIQDIYKNIEKISIDNGILERASNVYVIPADIGWSDLGTWTSVFENSDKDKDGNSVGSRHTFTYAANNNIIRARPDKALIVEGLRDYVVIDTDNALLICPKSSDQVIKEYIEDLRNIPDGENFI